MNVIDAILNLASILLWLNATVRDWSVAATEGKKPLLRTLERVVVPAPRRWSSLASLAALILIRSVFYWQIGSAVGWTPSIDLGPFSVTFRSDYGLRMLLYSVLSFSKWLLMLHVTVIFLSLLNRRLGAGDPWHRFMHHQLGMVGRWPGVVPVLLTLVGCQLLWLSTVYPLARMGIFPSPRSLWLVMGHGALLGIGMWIKLKWLVLTLLGLYLLNSYVYFGAHTFWPYVAMTGRQLLKPFAWIPLHTAKIDFAPLVAGAAYYLVFWVADRGLTWVFGRF